MRTTMPRLMRAICTLLAFLLLTSNAKHQFILDFLTIAADEITKAGSTILDDFNAGRCIEEAPGKYVCP